MKAGSLPASVALEAICYGHGERGVTWRIYRNSTLGITKVDRRVEGEDTFRTVWTIDGDVREFSTYAALREALTRQVRPKKK